jgi:hypothetical protein
VRIEVRHPPSTRLRQNLATATLSLTDSELTALEPLAAKVSGARYADMSSTPRQPLAMLECRDE